MSSSNIINRKTLATLLKVYQECIEKFQCIMDESIYESEEYFDAHKCYDATRGKRQGALELAYVLSIISEEEYEHRYGISNLIEILIQES